MNDQTDQQLLRDYSERQSDAAFAALVHRYVDLVHSSAFRMVNDTHAAKDVTQAVFVILGKNARQLTDRPALAGWLHGTARNIAAKAVRSEVRRRARDQEAAVMSEIRSARPDASWEHIAPHLDEALGELSEADRDAVLLRYFKNHDLRTVGATLGISDDAAQKRVSRAVERLREFFTKRGVTVGASGLSVVISANAVQAAPVGLALTISTAAALTGTTLAITATVTVTKTIAMTTLQKIAIAAVIAAGVAIPLVVRHQSKTKLNAANKAAQEQTTQTNLLLKENGDQSSDSATSSYKPSLEELRRRGEVARLRREQAEARVKSAQNATAASDAPVTHDGVQSRYLKAQQLARSGNAAEALREYLWCYDEGMVNETSFRGVRTSFLLNSIAELGKAHSEALLALRERRDSASQRFINGDAAPATAFELASLNRVLNDDQNTLSLLDQLPQGDSRRKPLAYGVYDQLVEAQRYGDAALGKSYEQIDRMFEMIKNESRLRENTPNLEMIKKIQKDSFIKSAAKGVEVLAGSGDLEHAQTLAGRLLTYDNSAETKALLQKHVTRAGQSDLLKSLPNQ